MWVLVATSRTQGWRKSDFSYTVDGELVTFPPLECDEEAIDGPCGCKPAMVGLSSNRPTTTVEVVEREDITLETYYTLVEDALKARGLTDELLEEEENRIWLNGTVAELANAALRLEKGTILERRGEFLTVREVRGQEAGWAIERN